MTGAESIQITLADEVASYHQDPLGFVRCCFPWGEQGPLEAYEGPDMWQEEFLIEWGEEIRKRAFNGVDAVAPIRMARSSGHGIGKGVMCGFITAFIMSTRPNSIGTVTANSFPQLETKTWATIQTWMRRLINASWFEIGPSRIYFKGARERCFCTPQTCREENSESFAGQHAATSTSWYILDESSNVPPIIWEVADGGLTDGEPMIFAFGNPTRNSGEFHSICFGAKKNRWLSKSIDSRDCKFPNKETIQEDLEVYGEDSDRFRVRVRGLPPSQGDLQYIDSQRVWDAQQRPAMSLRDDPIICGVDVARGGGDWNVVRFRKGLDARSIPPIRIPGERTRDSTVLVSKLAELLVDHRPERRIAFMFLDSALGGPIVNRLQQLGFRNVAEVNFGAASPDPHELNMRAYMWRKMKDWLLNGSIPRNDTDLETDLTRPGFHHNNRDQLVIESKESMEYSTDDGDALGLTFARPVAVPRPQISPMPVTGTGWS